MAKGDNDIAYCAMDGIYISNKVILSSILDKFLSHKKDDPKASSF
jgi:hypothetical protein